MTIVCGRRGSDNQWSRADASAHLTLSGWPMKLFYFLLLVLLIGAIVVFAVQNKDEVSIKYVDRSASFPLSAVVGAAYILGMFTGWTIIGLLRRSFQRVTEHRH
jgi:lipopolysaccharide assembly protein A